MTSTGSAGVVQQLFVVAGLVVANWIDAKFVKSLGIKRNVFLRILKLHTSLE